MYPSTETHDITPYPSAPYSTETHHHHHQPPNHMISSSSVSGIPNTMISPITAPPMHYGTYMATHSISSIHPHNLPAGEWSTGLCHCCDDPANCLTTAFCPCITFGQIAEILNKGSPSCTESGTLYGLMLAVSGLACLYSCFFRSKLRAQYDLREAPFGDFLVHFCCETCALCQEYRELKNRGYDMGIGWEANMDRQKRGVTMTPIVSQRMSR